MRNLSKALSGNPDSVAKRLLGCHLNRRLGNKKIVCKIVETEAYDQLDPASHSYRGMTPRNSIMFGEAGYLYVYFSYGIHYCMNIVTGVEGHASAVLIRAVEPISGLETIRSNRPKISKDRMLTNGPGKVCQALAIGRDFNGHDLAKQPLTLTLQSRLASSQIMTGKRIGITKGVDLQWRFFVKDNSYVSVQRRG
jgi:DNA-3-methyladenine glycosylase